MTPTTRDRFVNHSQQAWRSLVEFAFLCPPDQREDEIQRLAKRIEAPVANLKRKVEAILICRNVGHTKDQIIKTGQNGTMAASSRIRKKDAPAPENKCVISWRVSMDLAAAVKPDPEKYEDTESLQSRLMRVLKIRTHEELWEFILSTYADVDDATLQNWAGLFDRKKGITV